MSNEIIIYSDNQMQAEGMSYVFLVTSSGGNYQFSICDSREKLAHLSSCLFIIISSTGQSEIEVAKRLSEQGKRVLYLYLSLSDDQILSLIKSGVKGILSQNVKSECLINIVEGLQNNNSYHLDETIMNVVMRDYMNMSSSSNIKNNSLVSMKEESQLLKYENKLSDRELEVLNLLFNHVTTNKDIAQGLNVSESTVRHYISSIMQKLGAKDRTDLVIHAAKLGLVHF